MSRWRASFRGMARQTRPTGTVAAAVSGPPLSVCLSALLMGRGHGGGRLLLPRKSGCSTPIPSHALLHASTRISHATPPKTAVNLAAIFRTLKPPRPAPRIRSWPRPSVSNHSCLTSLFNPLHSLFWFPLAFFFFLLCISSCLRVSSAIEPTSSLALLHLVT